MGKLRLMSAFGSNAACGSVTHSPQSAVATQYGFPSDPIAPTWRQVRGRAIAFTMLFARRFGILRMNEFGHEMVSPRMGRDGATRHPSSRGNYIRNQYRQ